MRRPLLFALLLLLASSANAAPNSIEFIENKGQWKEDFRYRTLTDKGDVYFTPNSFIYVVGDYANLDKIEAYHHGMVREAQVLKYHEYRMTFEGAATTDILGGKQQKAYYNYFLGNDQSKWKSGIHPYLTLDYKHLYNGVDMHISSDEGALKYEFIIAPGADASLIQMRCDGADGLSVNKQGNLVIRTSVGDVQEMKPFAYQYINNVRTEVPCVYKVNGNHVTYKFPRGYAEGAQLVIDPTVVFATFTGSTADNFGYTATYDLAGNFYAGGLVHSAGYPVTPGAFQMTFGGGTTTTGIQYESDMGIIKFSPDGVNRIWATYLGGSDNDQPHSMVTDLSQNLVIAGRSYSNNFPVTTGCYDNTANGGGDLVVVKLNSTGTALIGSTYIGGSADDAVNFSGQEFVTGNLKYNYGDDARSEVILDSQQNVYVTTCTQSANFPVTANATQSVLKGTQDGVVMKLNPTLTSLTWSTYLGGSTDDAGYVLALNKPQTLLYVAGGTNSSDFPATAGSYHSSYQGGLADGFVARFQNSGTYQLQKCTYMGTANYDQCYGVQIDNQDSVYIMGQSLGGQFPVTPGVYSNPNSSQFVIKMDANLTIDRFSTVYGSGNPAVTNISPVAFLIDTCENIYISGWGGVLGPGMPASTGNTVGMPITPDAAQSTTDGNDFYFIVLSKNAGALMYGTFMGSNGGVGEHVDGGTSRFDRNGIVYQAICGACGHGTFPTQPANVWSLVDSSFNCNEVALKIAFHFGPVEAIAHINGDTSGCAPFTVTFDNTSTNGASYVWDFGDNSPISTQFNPGPHTYSTPGVYTVHLTVTNANACNRTIDSTTMVVKVDSGAINADFLTQLTDTCDPFVATVTNTSQYNSIPNSQSWTKFYWHYSDGFDFTGTTPPAHNFPDTGTYSITLVMVDTTACNNPDSVTKTIHFQKLLVDAAIDMPDSLCLGAGVTFANGSTNGITYIWNFGDGDTAMTSNPYHVYDSTGIYTVTVIAINDNACNHSDTASKNIKVKAHAIADFSYTPVIPVPNSPITFVNHSQNATSYLWGFGDGGSSEDTDPVHMYKKTGYYTVCLDANNPDNCPDTVCKKIYADIRPLIDIPNAFSPNGDGFNDILYARGAAIDTMDLKIWNRWGELVFESKSLDHGWDGTYNGKPQEMDAYAFVLTATFIDGTKFEKQGNITLLR
jgi:gliding motility-associated-like protein